MPLSGARVCLYEDGTIVTEEFFLTLADNTELVLMSKGQTWSGGRRINTRQVSTVNLCFYSPSQLNCWMIVMLPNLYLIFSCV